MDTETGEFGERRLEHGEREAEKFYRDLQQAEIRVRVGMEATGHARWFERLLEELHFELWIGDPLEIRATRVRKQKTDRHDAQLLLKLLLEDCFPRIWVASWENRDATTSVASASFGADAHTTHESVASRRLKRRSTAREAAVARKDLRKWMPQGIDVQVPSLTSLGTEQLEADDVMALARESNGLLSRNGLDWVESHCRSKKHVAHYHEGI
jgi:hypothetical protein